MFKKRKNIVRKKPELKVALITGGSSGIGREIAKYLAKRNIRIILSARNTARLARAYADIKKISPSSLILPADLTQVGEIEALAKKVKKEVAKIDILVNAAGIYHDEDKAFYNIDFDKYTQSQILETYSVGIIAPTLLCHALVPLMRKGSKIINISGTFDGGAKGWLPYYVSKKAIEDLTVGLAQELRSRQIQVNCISPSDTLTESYKRFFPQYANPKDCLSPSDIAKLALFLASKKADHLTGQIIEIKQKKVA